MARKLYDQDFMDAGCPASAYDESTDVDDSFWTYMTNYLIAAAAIGTSLGLFVLLFRMRRQRKQEDTSLTEQHRSSNPDSDETNRNVAVRLPTSMSTTYYIMVIVYFLFAGLSYGIAGVGHQVITEKGSSEQDVFERLTGLLLGIASWSWIAASALEYHHAIRNCEDIQHVISYMYLLIIAATIWVAVIVIFNQLVLMGVTVFISIMVAFTMAIWQFKKYGNLLFLSEIASLVSYIAGLVVQFTLSGVCGDDGYQDCFKDCPLPNPSDFNHNAIFHILACAYFIQYGLTKVIMMGKSTASQPTAAKGPTAEREPSEVESPQIF